MFGISDPWIWMAYLLCILSAVLCLVYGTINWNKGDEPVTSEDVAWVEDEKEVKANL